MAFTAPVTRALDYLVTPAVWNAEHVDNFNTAVMHLAARKSSDESIASSVTLQDDNDLILPVAANEVWQLRYILKVTIPVTPQLKMAFTFPASGDISLSGTEFNAAGTLTKISFQGTTTPTATQDFLGSTSNRDIVLDGVFVNAGNAGNLVLQWAQNVSNASATIMKANSTLWVVKLA
jgi:hypothetical protein